MFNIDIPRYERIWLIAGGVTLVIFLTLFGFMGVSMGLNPPGHMETIDPQAVFTTPPFDNPGVRSVGENEYEVIMVAQLFAFQPGVVTLPVGAKIHFKVTSPDVVHGMSIPSTNVNMMVIPGHITQSTYSFDQPGEYLVVCNAYCGVAHHLMMGRIVVE